LVEAGQLDLLTAERVARVQGESSDRLGAVLLKLGLLSEASLADAMGRYRGLSHSSSDATGCCSRNQPRTSQTAPSRLRGNRPR